MHIGIASVFQSVFVCMYSNDLQQMYGNVRHIHFANGNSLQSIELMCLCLQLHRFMASSFMQNSIFNATLFLQYLNLSNSNRMDWLQLMFNSLKLWFSYVNLEIHLCTSFESHNQTKMQNYSKLLEMRKKNTKSERRKPKNFPLRNVNN